MNRIKFNKQSTYFLWLFVIVLASLFLRTYHLNSLPIPLHIDEVWMTDQAVSILKNSRSLISSQMSTTVASNIITSFLIWLFGITPFIVRLQSVFFGVAGCLFTFLAAKELFDNKTAFIALILITTSHLNIAYSRLNLPNIQTIFFLTSSLYFAAKIIKTKQTIFGPLLGIFTALSLYSYSGAKIIPLLILLFIIFHINKFKKRLQTLSYAFLTALIIILPLLHHSITNNNFLNQDYAQRERDVFIVNKPHYWKDRWQTNNLNVVFIKQFKLNFLSLLNKSDYSNQYANGPLLDPISAILFYASLIIFLPLSFYFTLLVKIKRTKRMKNILYMIISFLIVLSFVSLTESPPLSTRLLIAQPFVIILIAVFLQKQAKTNKYAMKIVAVILAIIAILNFRLYFSEYAKKGSAVYSWIEPNYSIAKYIKNSKAKHIYIMATPNTYANQLTITTLNFNRKRNIKDIDVNQALKIAINKCQNATIIVPLYPKVNTPHFPKELNLSCQKSVFFGKKCSACPKIPLFSVFSNLTNIKKL